MVMEQVLEEEPNWLDEVGNNKNLVEWSQEHDRSFVIFNKILNEFDVKLLNIKMNYSDILNKIKSKVYLLIN